MSPTEIIKNKQNPCWISTEGYLICPWAGGYKGTFLMILLLQRTRAAHWVPYQDKGCCGSFLGQDARAQQQRPNLRSLQSKQTGLQRRGCQLSSPRPRLRWHLIPDLGKQGACIPCEHQPHCPPPPGVVLHPRVALMVWVSPVSPVCAPCLGKCCLLHVP